VKGDVIRLEFPARPEYILAVRLVVSAVAERCGFGIEDIEDLKVASAEACILLLDAQPDTIGLCITVIDGISAVFASQGQRCAGQDSQENLSQYLLEALVDKCEIVNDSGVIIEVRFEKKP
jgi:hypothetical protein